MASPIPRLAPVMKRVLPLRVDITGTLGDWCDVLGGIRAYRRHLTFATELHRVDDEIRSAHPTLPASVGSAPRGSRTGREIRSVCSRESARRPREQFRFAKAEFARMRDRRPQRPRAPS